MIWNIYVWQLIIWNISVWDWMTWNIFVWDRMIRNISIWNRMILYIKLYRLKYNEFYPLENRVIHCLDFSFAQRVSPQMVIPHRIYVPIFYSEDNSSPLMHVFCLEGDSSSCTIHVFMVLFIWNYALHQHVHYRSLAVVS